MKYTVEDCLEYGRKKLSLKNINTKDSDFLLPVALGESKEKITPFMMVGNKKFKKFKKLIRLRCKKVSLDKLIGYTEFINITIPFSRHTLTPRQETEILVDRIINEYKDKEDLDVLDLCTGSGCIGIAIAKNIHSSRVVLSDISKKAIKRARHNARINNVQIEAIISNLFDNIGYKFDIIVSNPPYIPTGELNELEKEVKKYDPKLALDGGKDGLDFYRKISSESSKYLKNNGKLYLEIGYGEARDIVSLLSNNFEDIKVIKDYSGIERFIIAEKVRNI